MKQKLIIDGYNVLCAAAAQRYGLTVNDFHLHVGRLADRVAAMSNVDITTTAVSVHLGVATPFQDRYRSNREAARSRRWRRDRRVHVAEGVLVPDAYGTGLTEHGVDEAIGADLLASQAGGEFDRIVLFTADRDLHTELEAAYIAYGRGASRTRIELARWQGQRGLSLPGRNIHTHWLGVEDFDAVTTFDSRMAA